MSATPLGERLTQLRARLAAIESITPDRWSRTAVARGAQLPYAALDELEAAGAGTAANLAALLLFYHNQGIDLAWILTPNNDNLPLHALRGESLDEAINEAVSPLRKLQGLLKGTATALATKQQLRPQVLPALVEMVQTGLGCTLGHLQPPNPWQPSEVKLAEPQRLLPLVRAAAAGWYLPTPRAVTAHHYAKHETLPRCGSRFNYLEKGQENTPFA